MVKIDQIRIKNYKGIKDLTLEVEAGKAHGRYITLVGLNESGKTSILEAISLSILQDQDTADMLEAIDSGLNMSDVIPKHEAGSFEDNVEISVSIDFSGYKGLDAKLKSIISKHGLYLTGSIPLIVSATKSYIFSNSEYKSFTTQWGFTPQVKKSGPSKPDRLFVVSSKAWQECIAVLRDILPSAIYFPSFLVNFPTRVYLEGAHGDVDKYYRNIVSDALNGLESPLSIDEHVIKRVDKFRKTDPNFSSALRSSAEGKSISAVVQKLAAELNFVIFGAWSEIFGKAVRNRRIVLEWHIDEQAGNHIYIEFVIEAGGYRFSVAERSLGFRWFFAFLLFTQFQRSRNKTRKLLFLFDEPASNLHPKAQERLLKSFEKISDPNHVIIYSTHSHYLVNPLWLEKAYIITNDAHDMDGDDGALYESESKVIIKAEKYRSFVSNNPSKTTYFQPVLDVLDYSSSGLDLSGPAIILEGKYDYYPFVHLLKLIGRANDIRVIPAVGAGGLVALISILRGWGVKFVVLLDDDETGRKEKEKYKNTLMCSSNQVITLDELDPDLIKCEFEGIFKADVRDSVISEGFSKGPKITKNEFYAYFQALESGQIANVDMPDTVILFTKMIDGIMKRLSKQ